MPRKKTIEAADLFSGAGGASGGLARACRRLDKKLRLRAVNHWPVSVQTHAANFPDAVHLCAEVENVNPRQLVPGGKLDILLAGPSCVFHSNARGGKPVNDQQRASAWCILRWATELQIDTILIENVREFARWGGLGANGRPLKARRGETFQAFLQAFRSLGYRVDHRVLNAADYGDPTTRERLFIQCRRGRRPITWPEPTHTAQGGPTLFGTLKPWRPARDIIDWSLPGQSIFTRKKPLRPTTLARIAAGIQKFCGPLAEPFLVLLNGGGCQGAGGARSLDRPLPTLTAGGEHVGLVQPYLLQQQSGGAPRSTGQPVPTIATAGAIALVQPYLLSREHSGKPAGPPFVVPTNHGATQGGAKRVHPLDRPLPTVTTVDAWGLVQPYLVRYHNNRPEVAARDLNDPLPAADCHDRYGLVQPVAGLHLDILFRMLQPHELAAAMSFPRDYVFCGNREQKVRQVGNAWAGEISERLCYELLAA